MYIFLTFRGLHDLQTSSQNVSFSTRLDMLLPTMIDLYLFYFFVTNSRLNFALGIHFVLWTIEHHACLSFIRLIKYIIILHTMFRNTKYLHVEVLLTPCTMAGRYVFLQLLSKTILNLLAPRTYKWTYLRHWNWRCTIA